MNVVWWGLRWPWRWRFYYVRRPEFGWAELMLGFVGFVWPIDSNQDKGESA